MSYTQEVDLSYKHHALRVTYDIESTRDLFTIAMIHDNAFTLMFFGNEQFDRIKDEHLIEQMQRYAKKNNVQKYMRINSYKDIDYHLHRYRVGDKASINELKRDLLKMVMCKPIRTDMQYIHEKNKKDKFVEYCGYNSANYDMNLLILANLTAERMKENLTPSDIRDMSNLLINFRDGIWKLPDYINEHTHGAISGEHVRQKRNLALWSDGHIDWSIIARQSEDELTPPSLKTIMANMGLDVIFDETVADDNFRTYSDEECNTMIEYNFNDVLGTKLLGELSFIKNEMEVRDTIRELYPYTSARSVPLTKIKTVTPEARDVTGARISGLVLVGEKRIKPKDYRHIHYEFPVPAGKDGKEVRVSSLWEYIKSKEEYVPEHLDKFFTHYDGKDVSTRDLYKKANREQPVNHSSVMKVVYFRDGQPTDTGVDVSTGGGHGGVIVGARKFTSSEIQTFVTSTRELKKSEKSTFDVKNVFNIDFDSFYPMNNSKIKAYLTSEGIDRYTPMIYKRFDIKRELKVMKKEKKTHTKEYNEKNKTQNGFKYVLNATTGASNTYKKYALLPLDNKTLSMRLMGNMLIWSLGQRMTQAGGFVGSTNTDGIYVTGLSKEKVDEVVAKYIEDYGVDVGPDALYRLINRDVSTRIEFANMDDPKEITKISGELKHATGITFKEESMTAKVPYPLISAHAVLKYMIDDEDWLQKPYDRERLKKYILDEYNKEVFTPSAWFHVYVGSKARRLLVNGEIAQKVNRIFLTKTGVDLSNEQDRALSLTESLKMWNMIQRGVSDYEQLKVSDIQVFDDALDVGQSKPIDFTGTLKDVPIKDRKFDFITGYKPYKTADSIYSPLKVAQQEMTEAQLRAINTGKKNKILGYYDEVEKIWKPVKMWKVGKMTNYTTTTGMIANMEEDLETFDKENLDLDAYLRWSEQLLGNWKITGDIPDINMVSVDDTVVPDTRPKRRTKIDDAIDMLKDIYGILNPDVESE